MRSTPLLVLASFLSVALGQGTLVINTPAPPAHCEPTFLSWSGGQPPYIVSVVDGKDETKILENFGPLANLNITWEVTEPVGQTCVLIVKDNTGLTQNSGVITVQPGTNTCDHSSSSSSFRSTSTSGSATKVGTSAKPSASKSSASSVGKKTSATVTSIVGLSTQPSASASTVLSSDGLSSIPTFTAPVPPVSASSSVAVSPSSSSSGVGPTGVPAAAAAVAIGAVGAVFAALI